MKCEEFILLHGIPKDDFYPFLKDQIAVEKGSRLLIPEMRPHLYGSKILAARLLQEHIVPTLITDNMMGFFFYRGLVKQVHLFFINENSHGILAYPGATLVALLCRHHKVKLNTVQGGKPTETSLDIDSSSLLGKRILSEGIEALKVENELIPWEMMGGRC